MSCALALATPSVALVCADTRLNLRFRTGVSKHMDIGSVTFKFPEGTELRIGESQRKIRRLRSGWATGAGCFPLLHWCFQGLTTQDLQDPKAIERVLRDTLRRYGDAIRQHLPGSRNEIDRTTLLLAYDRGREFSVRRFRFNRQDLRRDEAQFYLLSPPELSAHAATQASTEFGQRFQAPRDMRGVVAGLRIIADTFYNMHRKSSTVSDMIEVGMMLRMPAGDILEFHLLAKAPSVMDSCEAELTKLLRPI